MTARGAQFWSRLTRPGLVFTGTAWFSPSSSLRWCGQASRSTAASRSAVDLAEKPALRAVIDGTLKELRGGQSLAQSLAAKLRISFRPLCSPWCGAGEASGMLPAVLDRLVEFEEFQCGARGYLISALIYPMLLLTVVVWLSLFLLGFCGAALRADL